MTPPTDEARAPTTQMQKWRKRIDWFDREIETLEDRVLNASTVEAARLFHDRLDQLRDKRFDLAVRMPRLVR